MPSQPPWWTANMPDLVSKREQMPSVERLQTMYVRYKCQPEAQVTAGGWDLTTSQRFADQLAAEEQQAYLREESLLYNGLAPTSIALRIVEAPAEFAVPVKQDRRLTPNFKVRVEVGFKGRCSFPLTLKVYFITQQERDSVPEWVPDDFLDPELPPRKPITELKGTTVITHHFEGAVELDEEQQEQQKQQQQQLAAQAAQALLSGGDGTSGLAGLTWGADMDPQLVESVLQESARTGAIDATTAAALAASMQVDTATNPIELLTNALGGGAGGGGVASGASGSLEHDYEFAAVELVKPTRMNKVYLVFACSILEQDLMFVVYNIPTIGICRAEQRAKACAKLGLSYTELGGGDYPDGASAGVGGGVGGGGQLQLQQQGGGLRSLPNGLAAGGDGASTGFDGSGLQQQQQQQQLQLAQLQQQQSRKRPGSQQGVWGPDAVLGGLLQSPDGLGGLPGGDLASMQAALGGLGALGMPMQMDASNLMAGLSGGGPGSAAGMPGGGYNGLLGGGVCGMLPAAAMLPGGPDCMAPAALTAGAAGAGEQPGGGVAAVGPVPRSRAALRAALLREYEAAGLTRRLSGLDLQALELQAGLPLDSSGDGGGGISLGEQQWGEFLGQFRELVQLLRLVSNVWNREDPCVMSGFDMDAAGAAAALASQPPGTAVCCFSPDVPGCVVLTCKQHDTRGSGGGGGGKRASANGGPDRRASDGNSDGDGDGDGDAGADGSGDGDGGPGVKGDGLLRVVVKAEDLAERRLETWLRDLAAVTHVLDVYRGSRTDKRVLLGASKYARLRAMDPLDAYDDILI